MSENREIDPSVILAKTKAELIKTVTPQEVVDYLNHVNGKAKCSYCNEGELGVSAAPDGKKAALVSCDVPGRPGIGMWLFPASCVNCGMTLFFTASKVAEWLEGERGK